MSAKKVIVSTKVPVEESPDSGYLSGPVKFSDEENLDSGILSGPLEADKPETSTRPPKDSVRKTEEDYQDSGCLSGVLSEELSSYSQTQLEDPVVVELKEGMSKCTIADNIPTIVEQSPASISDQLQIPIARVFQQDADGDTVVHITAVHGCKMRTALLIKLCPDPSWLDITNDYGHTALHLAVMSGHAVIARMLVNAGASLTIRDHMGETPLHTAVNAGNRECLLALLDPAPGRQTMRAAVFNQTNYNGQACVHIAARKGDVDILQTLVYYGADINVKDGCAGWTPLHIAARAGNEAVSRYLLERCPGVAKHACDYAGRTPLRLSRHTNLYGLYTAVYKQDDESDTDDDEYDGDDLFEKLQSSRAVVAV